MSFRALGIRGKCPRSHFVPTDYWPLIIAKSLDFDLKHPVMIDHRAFRASVIVLIYMIARSIVFQYSERAKHPGSLNRRQILCFYLSQQTSYPLSSWPLLHSILIKIIIISMTPSSVSVLFTCHLSFAINWQRQKLTSSK